MGIVLSVVLGLVALVASRAALGRLTADDRPRDPHVYWGVGLITLLPPWLVLFVSLLGSTPGSRPRGSGVVFFVLSAAAALLGAIATEARVRDAGEVVPVREAARLWRLGVLAVVPAWALVLVGHVVR